MRLDLDDPFAVPALVGLAMLVVLPILGWLHSPGGSRWRPRWLP
jgi:hypothetical protein